MDLAHRPSPWSISIPPPTWNFLIFFLWSVWKPLFRGRVMSQSVVGVPSLATRRHSLWVIVFVFWTAFPHHPLHLLLVHYCQLVIIDSLASPYRGGGAVCHESWPWSSVHSPTEVTRSPHWLLHYTTVALHQTTIPIIHCTDDTQLSPISHCSDYTADHTITCNKPWTSGALKSCRIHRIYELNAHERYHKVVITSGKLEIFFKPRVSKLGACQWENMSDAMDAAKD